MESTNDATTPVTQTQSVKSWNVPTSSLILFAFSAASFAAAAASRDRLYRSVFGVISLTALAAGLIKWRITPRPKPLPDLPFDDHRTLDLANEVLPSHLFVSSFPNEQQLPLLVCLREDAAAEEAQSWLQGNPEQVKDLLDEYGALRFRGLNVENADAFGELVSHSLGELLDYRGGDGARRQLSENYHVYTSTEAPAWADIPLHNELSHSPAPRPPEYICFFCKTAPTAGTGRTTLGRTERVTALLQGVPELWRLFEGKNLKYTFRHPHEGSLYAKINSSHKTWEKVFETTDKAEVEALCTAQGRSLEWKGKWAEVTHTAPAINTEGETPLFFNQAPLTKINPGLTGQLNYVLARTIYSWPGTMQSDCTFEDGTQIPQWALDTIYAALREATVSFDWQEGDVMFVNNRTGMHGKSSSQGERSIWVAMVRRTETTEAEQEETSPASPASLESTETEESFGTG